MNTVKARMIDQSHFMILSPIPSETKEFHVVLEESVHHHDALTALRKISGLISDLDDKRLKLFDENIKHNSF